MDVSSEAAHHVLSWSSAGISLVLVFRQQCYYYIITTTLISFSSGMGFSGIERINTTQPGSFSISRAYHEQCFHIENCLYECFIPCGRVMQAPSTIAWASSRSLHSRARAAALSASQISFRPSNAGAVSQNSSLLLLSWPSVIGYSLFHLGRSFLRGSLRAVENIVKRRLN